MKKFLFASLKNVEKIKNIHQRIILRQRIESLICLYYFLSLRQKIKQTVQENYQTGIYDIVTYDEWGFVEFENEYIYQDHLQPLIDDYINKCVAEIECKTLKLEL